MRGRIGIAIKAVLATLVIGFLAIVVLALMLTDLGSAGGRDLEAGLFADRDWLIHLHRPEELLTVLGSEGDLLADPNWRWMLGLAGSPASKNSDQARTLDIVNELASGEVLLAGAWADGASAGGERLLAVFRPESTRGPRLLQLARSRWLFDRFFKPNLPIQLSATWIDGLILLGTADGSREFVIGSARDLIVIGSRQTDVRAYLRAQEQASASPGAGPTARLDLSPRARGQLTDALSRVLGLELLEAALPLLSSAEESRQIRKIDCRPGPAGELAFEWTTSGGGAADDAETLTRALNDRFQELQVEPSGSRPGASLLLEVRAGAEAASMILNRLEADRLASEAEPKGAKLDQLRRELSPGAQPMSDELFKAQLVATRAIREERVRRETACWRDLMAQGFRFIVKSEGSARSFEFSLTRPFP